MGDAARTGTPKRRFAGALLAGAACLGFGGCTVPRALNPVEIWREVSGANDAKRPTPPGLDRPFPSLGTVPPRPERPSPEAREAVTAALAEDRNRARDPLVPRPAPGGGGAAAGSDLSPGPPPPPSLAAAPRVPWTEAPTAPPPPAARGGRTPAAATPPEAPRPPTARPGTPASDMPDAPPAPPPPDLLGAPPPPPPDLLAPPPPARR